MEEYYPLLAATPLFADIPPEALEEETARRRPVVKQLSLFD